MPKRKARTQRILCPDTYVDSLEEEFGAAIGEGLKGKDIPKRLLEPTKLKLLEMRASVFDAIRARVEPMEDPAADAVPQPLDRTVLARIAEAERRLEAASASAKRLRREVPAALEEAAERVSAAAEKALTAPVEADADDREEEEEDAATAAAASSKAASASALAAATLLRQAAAAVTGEAGRVEAAAQAVTLEARIGTTDADRAAAGKGAKGRPRR